MKVTTSFFGPIRKLTRAGPIELPEGSVLADLLAAIRYEEHHWSNILALRDSRRLRLEDPLFDGDELELTIRVGGG